MSAATIQYEASIFDRLVVTSEAAEAILMLRLSHQDEDRMRELMEKNNANLLSSEEQAEMEAFRRIGSFIAILQAKARLLAGNHFVNR